MERYRKRRGKFADRPDIVRKIRRWSASGVTAKEIRERMRKDHHLDVAENTLYSIIDRRLYADVE